MNDRELLERAARAVGRHLQWSDCGDLCWLDREMDGCTNNDDPWSPLIDDGDAFRLSAELELNVFHAAGSAYAMPSDFEMNNEKIVSYRDAGGKAAAQRRSIVRAAAAMGEQL